MDHLYPYDDDRRAPLSRVDTATIPYKPFAEAIVHCLENNPARFVGNELWDPPTAWLRDIHFAVVNALSLRDWKNVVVMPTLKTSADVHHGIDFLVIYDEPTSNREVIVSVDLSLRQKRNFKADVLITDTCVTPNDVYYNTPGTDIPDAWNADKEEERHIEQQRRTAIGETIASIIREKLINEDPHYGQTMRRIERTVRQDLATLLATENPRRMRSKSVR